MIIFLPAIEEYDLENMALLQGTFPGRVICRSGDINWFDIKRFDPIRLFCGATRKTVFMQINIQLLST